MTGKNSITGNPKYKMTGRILIGTPYKSIINQAAYDAWHSDQDYFEKLYFAHSSIETVVEGFKKFYNKTLRFITFQTMKGEQLSKNADYSFITTYDQILNINHEQMELLDYVVIDESHTFSSAMNYRANKIARLINHLIEFVAKKPHAKTKIVFMTGTPDVEALVIPQLMKEQNIEDLYQLIKVDKTYSVAPTINLIHLDEQSTKKRGEVILKQTVKYTKEDRKVVHIFNCKDKMDFYHREIQSKLSNSIKVGLFYSGSEGTCTDNILSGKFDDYDVVLTTTFYINGININLDKLSPVQVSKNKTSTQKYGVIIDLQNLHKKINALEAVQVVNRFRNRLCDCTVLFPSLFPANDKNPSNSFNYHHTERLLLGINKYNRQFLSINQKKIINHGEEAIQEDKIFLLDSIRKTPEKITLQMINEKIQKSKDELAVINSFKKKSNIYQDWFYSLDGFNYMAKDAGFNIIIDNANIIGNLKKMTLDQIDLENRVIKNFLDDEDGLFFLKNHLDHTRNFKVIASDLIKETSSDSVGNFKFIETRNGVHIMKGDFHPSQERALNKMIKYHLRLSYLYGIDKALQIFRFLINDEAKFAPFKEKRYLQSITNYIKPFYYINNEYYLKGINYLRTLDFWSQKNVGVDKITEDTHYSFTIKNPELVDQLKLNWAKQQFSKIEHAIDNCQLEFEESKTDLKEKFSDESSIREIDLEDLEEQLSKLTIYKPMKKDANGNVKSYERIIIPRLLRYDNLLSNTNFSDVKTIAPEYSDLTDANTEFDNFVIKLLKRLDSHISFSLRKEYPKVEEIYTSLKDNLKNKEIHKSIEYVNYCLENTNLILSNEVNDNLNLFKKEFSSLGSVLLSSFKTSEYGTYKEIHKLQTNSFLEKLFFCDKNFILERLDKKFDGDLDNFKITDIYDTLNTHTNLFTKNKKLRVRSTKGRITINPKSSDPCEVTKRAYVILNAKKEIIYAHFKKEETLKYLCEYAFKNQGFIMEDGSIPVKYFFKGIYNSDTFRLDYYDNSSKSNIVANYKIKIYDINIKNYVKYVQNS